MKVTRWLRLAIVLVFLYEKSQAAKRSRTSSSKTKTFTSEDQELGPFQKTFTSTGLEGKFETVDNSVLSGDPDTFTSARPQSEGVYYKVDSDYSIFKPKDKPLTFRSTEGQFSKPIGEYEGSLESGDHGGGDAHGGHTVVHYSPGPIIAFSLLGFSLGVLVGAACFSRKKHIRAA